MASAARGEGLATGTTTAGDLHVLHGAVTQATPEQHDDGGLALRSAQAGIANDLVQVVQETGRHHELVGDVDTLRCRRKDVCALAGHRKALRERRRSVRQWGQCGDDVSQGLKIRLQTVVDSPVVELFGRLQRAGDCD